MFAVFGKFDAALRNITTEKNLNTINGMLNVDCKLHRTVTMFGFLAMFHIELCVNELTRPRPVFAFFHN